MLLNLLPNMNAEKKEILQVLFSPLVSWNANI